jgi:metal-dependent amidase/aminoacylase/carboxypeptidase family protein
MINDAAVVKVIRNVAADLLGKGKVTVRERTMGAEDFGQLSSLAPGAMFGLGCELEGDDRRGHSPTFDLDERCLVVGAAVLAEVAVRLMREKRPTEIG